MVYYKKTIYTVHKIEYYIGWVTKYRYEILKDHIWSSHIHLLISCLITISISKIIKYLKWRYLKFMHEEFVEFSIAGVATEVMRKK